MQNFEELNLSDELKRAIAELGFTKPSDIQAQALPLLLGKSTDFLGLAATGTGKTAAFSIPLLEKIDTQKRVVQGLILCPTRELALQVAGQINLLGKYKGIKAVPVYGGSSYADQIYGLKNGANIVVGTPGRVVDHIERGTLNLENLSTLILDEADEMISMGFKDELEKVLESAPRETANIWCFSATMSTEVRRVADAYLRKPEQVRINKTEMLSATVEQIYYMTKEGNKAEVLCKLIDAADNFFGLIFCQTKALVMDLTQYLVDHGYKVDCLHGDKDQRARERTMQAFRDHRVQILVCTDVASRGLDVKDVTHVINYSLPRELDNYVHRIGRTARSGKTGIAMSLVTPSHRRLIFDIERMTKSRMTEGRIPTRRDIGVKKVSTLLPKFQSQVQGPLAVELLDEKWREALKELPPEEIAGKFLALLMPDLFAKPEERARLPGPINQQTSFSSPSSPAPQRDRSSGDRPYRERSSYGSGGGDRDRGDRPRAPQRDRPSYGGDRERSSYGRSGQGGDDRGRAPYRERAPYAGGGDRDRDRDRAPRSAAPYAPRESFGDSSAPPRTSRPSAAPQGYAPRSAAPAPASTENSAGSRAEPPREKKRWSKTQHEERAYSKERPRTNTAKPVSLRKRKTSSENFRARD